MLAQGQLWRDALLIEHGLLRLYFVRRDCALFTLLWIAVRLHRLERGARMTVQGEAGAGAAL